MEEENLNKVSEEEKTLNDSAKEETSQVLEEMRQEEQRSAAEVVEENSYMQTKTMNMMALISFIFSIIGLFIFGLPLGIAAVILGIISIVTFKQEIQKGRGLGIAGIVIGAIDSIYVILALVVRIMQL